jgi:hypothetical protein
METKPTVENLDAEPKIVASSTTTEIDAQTRIAELEAEKAQLATERDNYKIGLLKVKGRNPEFNEDNEEDEKYRRIAREELNNSRIAELAREQDEIIKKALIENKELKAALKNKPSTTSVSSGTESTLASQNTGILSKEQIDLLKARGWGDKKIEMLKKNIQKNNNRR